MVEEYTYYKILIKLLKYTLKTAELLVENKSVLNEFKIYIL